MDRPRPTPSRPPAAAPALPARHRRPASLRGLGAPCPAAALPAAALPAAALVAAALFATAPLSAGCASRAARPAAAAAAEEASGAEAGAGGVDLPAVPGVDLAPLPGPARATLAAVLSDEFCHCGCPHTVGQCLETHACRHAGRMARLAAREASAGASAADISLALGRHYAGYAAARARLAPDPRMCTGPADAPVTLVEFSDFECPYCAMARPLLEAFAKRHADRVRFCSLPFPLAGHPNALPAGEAVLFARDQGRFWAMHDALFEHQADLGPAALPAVARGAGLDAKALRAALETGRYRAELEAFKEQGRKAGVDSTPSLFLNGRRYTLPLEEAGLEQALEEELEWQSNHGAWTADD